MVCNYDSQLNPATHLRPIQTSVREVLKWFSELSPHTRIEFVCGLLQLSTAPELRFYGSCLEEIARQDYDDLLDAELRANSPLDNYGVFSLRHIILTKLSEFPPVPSSAASVPPTFIIFKNNPNLRSKLTLSLSLLKSTNVAAATSYFEILMADEQYPLRMYDTPQCISTSLLSVPNNMKSTISSDESDEEGFLSLHLKPLDIQLLDEIILIYTLAAYHPAFSFDQRQRLYKRVSFLRAISKHYCENTVKDFNNSSEDSELQNVGVDSKSPCLNLHCHHNNCPSKSNFTLPKKYCFCCDRPSLIQECADSRLISNSHFGSTLCHSSGCFYRHSILHRLRRHSLPSEYMRKSGFAKIMAMPFRNSHVICPHLRNNSEHNKSSLQTYSRTQSSTAHNHNSSIKSLRRREHSGSSTNTNRSSISQVPQSSKCFSCKCIYDEEDGNDNVKQSKNCIPNPNYLNEVHLWLANPSRPSIIPNSFNKSCNPTFFSPSVYASSTFSIPVTYDNSISQTNTNIDEDLLVQTNHSCGSNLISRTDRLSDYADDDTHSSVELCSNPTETLQANGSAAYTDLLQTVTNLASVSISSRDSCRSHRSSEETCSIRQMNTTTPDSTFLFGSDKSITGVVDYCRMVSKRHSSGSSPISTPPSEECGSDAVAVTTSSSSEYWIPRETPSACISTACRQFHSNFKSDHYLSKNLHNSDAGFSSLTEFTNSDCVGNIRDIPSKTSTSSSTQNLSVACSLSKVGTSFTFSSTVPTAMHLPTKGKSKNSNISCSISTSTSITNELASSAYVVVSTCATSSYLTETQPFDCNCNCFSQNKDKESHKDFTQSRVNGEKSFVSVNCPSHVFMEDEKQSNRSSKNAFIHSLNQQPSSCSECSFFPCTEALGSTKINLSTPQVTKTSTCLVSTGVCLIQSTSIHTNSPRVSSFAVPPSHYWVSPHGQMPFLSSTFYPPFVLSSPPSFVLENPQSIPRFPWFYQWTVHPSPPTSNCSTFPLYPASENNNSLKQCETSVHQTLIPNIIQSSFIEHNKDSSDCSLNQIDCSTSTLQCNGNSSSLIELKPTENTCALVSQCTLLPHASMVYPSYIDIFRPGFVPFSSNSNNNLNSHSRLPSALPSNNSSSNLASPLAVSVSTTSTLNSVSDSLDLDQITSKSNCYNSILNFPALSTLNLNSTATTVSSQTTNRLTQNSSDQKSGMDYTTDELQRMSSTLSRNTRLDASVENDHSVVSWPTSEASCNSWFYQSNMNARFTTKPESTGLAPTSARPLSGSNTRTYSSVFSNAMFPRGCLHPHLTNVFYYGQQPAVTFVATPTHHSSVLSNSHSTTHLNFPPPPHTFTSSSTTMIPFDNYVGTSGDASVVSVTSAKSNTTSVSQLSNNAVMPLSGPLVSTGNVPPAIFHLHGVPLSPNFLLHPPMYPTFSPQNLPPPVNTPIAVSLWSTLNTGSRFVSCYNCGRPGHKANICPTKWSNYQFSENTFSLNCAPTK